MVQKIHPVLTKICLTRLIDRNVTSNMKNCTKAIEVNFHETLFKDRYAEFSHKINFRAFTVFRSKSDDIISHRLLDKMSTISNTLSFSTSNFTILNRRNMIRAFKGRGLSSTKSNMRGNRIKSKRLNLD